MMTVRPLPTGPARTNEEPGSIPPRTSSMIETSVAAISAPNLAGYSAIGEPFEEV